MAARLPLPLCSAMPEVVIFHREHPADPLIVLQIPNSDRTDSQTYMIRTDRSDDKEWLDRLPMSRELMDQLSMERHVVFYPKTGHCQSLDDLDDLPLITIRLNEARRSVSSSPIMTRMQRAINNRTVPVSPLRQSLMRGWDR